LTEHEFIALPSHVMSSGIFLAFFVIVGKLGETRARGERLIQERDEVELLQVSMSMAHRGQHRSSQPSHKSVATPLPEATRRRDLKPLPDLPSPPQPHIMLVIFAALALSIATWVLYRISLLACQRWFGGGTAEATNALDLTASFVGILICFCSYGICQEFIMTQPYGADKFPSVAFLILCNRIFIVAVAISLLAVKGERIMWRPILMVGFPGASSLVSTWCQYECLHYVTFPTTVVFKSAKIVPTMLINTLVNREWQSFTDYVQGGVITECVLGFSLLTEEASGHVGETNTAEGLVMLSVFVLGDALTSSIERFIFGRYPGFSNTQMMFGMGVVGLVYSGVAVAIEPGGYPVMIAFLQKHPECLTQLLALSLCSVGGQYLVCYIIKRHGPVVLAIMMTVRQILSIFVSAALYGHVIPFEAVVLAAMCFTAILAKQICESYSYSTNERNSKEGKSRAGH